MTEIFSDEVQIIACSQREHPVILNLLGKIRQDLIYVGVKSFALFGRGAVVVRKEEMVLVNNGLLDSVPSAAYIIPTSDCGIPGIDFIKKCMHKYDPEKQIIVCINSGTSLKCGQIVL
jgi:hypothetical protein